MEQQESLRITPKWITSLQKDEVFVFGSNINGMHGGGAARVAMDKFGAIWGQGEGLQGQSYAIPTMEGLANIPPAGRLPNSTMYSCRQASGRYWGNR